jgi:hypothetical protein
MAKIHLAFLCFLGIAACTSISEPSKSAWSQATFTGTLPQPDTEGDDKGGAPDTTTLPLGVGFTTGPTSLLLGASLDFPVDKMITFGPALQYGSDNNVTLTTVTGQLKYFLPMDSGGAKQAKFLPYMTAGIGVASVDKDGRSGDQGAVLNIGAGLRMLTGEHYKIGTEGRLNYMPDDLGGENAFFSFELVQLIITF